MIKVESGHFSLTHFKHCFVYHLSPSRLSPYNLWMSCDGNYFPNLSNRIDGKFKTSAKVIIWINITKFSIASALCQPILASSANTGYINAHTKLHSSSLAKFVVQPDLRHRLVKKQWAKKANEMNSQWWYRLTFIGPMREMNIFFFL